MVKALPAALALMIPLAMTSELVAILCASTVPPVTLRNEISPAVLLVLPMPVPRRIVTLPVPALIKVPLAIVMAAAPASRCASITPVAKSSLAYKFRLPLSVSILAFNRMLRPACRVSVPPLPLTLLTRILLLTVMSLLACRITFCGVDSRLASCSALNVTVPVGRLA